MAARRSGERCGGRRRKALPGPRSLRGAAALLSVLGILAGPPFPEGGRKARASEKKTEPAEPGPMVRMDPLVINLNEESAGHYLKTTLVLEIAGREWVEEVQRKIPALADLFILTLGAKKLTDLRHPRSREEIRAELLDRAQKILASPKVIQVYFDEFLYQ